MPECDKTTCSAEADVVARFPKNETIRTYCQEHFRELQSFEWMEIEEHRRL